MYCPELQCSEYIPCPVHQDKKVSSDEAALFTFGVIADIQYCDRDDGHNYDRTIIRRYRHAFDSVTQAVDEWKGETLQFIVQLGDVIDGSARLDGASELTTERVLKAFAPLVRPTPFPFLVHTIGNHELYNFNREQLPKVLLQGTESSNPFVLFHSFSPFPGWRFIVLDPFDLAIIGWDRGHPNRVEALRVLREHNPNDVESDADWRTGLTGLDRRWMPYNGGIGAEQLAWLSKTLKRTEENGERAVILTHVPMCPGSATDLTLLWNYDEVLQILHSSPAVVAVLAGHEHDGGYVQDAKGIHHVTLASPLESPPDQVAFGSVDVFPDRLELRGRGTVSSRTLRHSR